MSVPPILTKKSKSTGPRDIQLNHFQKHCFFASDLPFFMPNLEVFGVCTALRVSFNHRVGADPEDVRNDSQSGPFPQAAPA